MSEEVQISKERAKRVKTLKKMIIWAPFVLVAIAYGVCTVLFVRTADLNRELKAVREDLDRTLQMIDSQQTILERMEGQLTEALLALEKKESENIQTPDSILSNPSGAAPEIITAKKDISEYDHRVYLTFDDGPSPNTENILEILDRYDVKATFFVIGKEEEQDLERLRLIAEKGHTVGMHSYTHRYAEIYQSLESFSQDFEQIRQYIFDAIGQECHLYRFPGGSSNQVSKTDIRIFADYLDTRDTVFFDWNSSAGDAVNYKLTADELVENCMINFEKNSDVVVLMHDSAMNPNTVEALPKLIERILERGDSVILPITESTEPIQHLQR